MRRSHGIPPSPTRADLIRAFDSAPDSATFDQVAIAAVRGCSTSKLERDRWAGTGLAYLKDGSRVRYRKSDVLAALAALPEYRSTIALSTCGGCSGTGC